MNIQCICSAAPPVSTTNQSIPASRPSSVVTRIVVHRIHWFYCFSLFFHIFSSRLDWNVISINRMICWWKGSRRTFSNLIFNEKLATCSGSWDSSTSAVFIPLRRHPQQQQQQQDEISIHRTDRRPGRPDCPDDRLRYFFFQPKHGVTLTFF